MSRSNLLDRLNHELEAFGKKAQAALDEGKLQIEQLRVRRRRDQAARDLGLLVYRRERTGEVEPRRVEALLGRLDELEAELTRLDGQLAQARRQSPTGSPPAPPATPAAESAAGPATTTEPAQPGAGPVI
jgi:outer membrane protein TolC